MFRKVHRYRIIKKYRSGKPFFMIEQRVFPFIWKPVRVSTTDENGKIWYKGSVLSRFNTLFEAESWIDDVHLLQNRGGSNVVKEIIIRQ